MIVGCSFGCGSHRRAPVNIDVSAALAVLERDPPAVEAWARGILADPTPCAAFTGSIAAMPSLHTRLEATNVPEAAAQLRSAVYRWHRIVRRAIGLSRPPQPLIRDGVEVHCPLHDDPPTVLLQPGDEGTLHDPDAPERVTWRRDEVIYCPHPDCKAEWRPATYRLLGKLVADAARRRAA